MFHIIFSKTVNLDVIPIVSIFLIIAYRCWRREYWAISYTAAGAMVFWAVFSPRLEMTIDFIHGYPRVLENNIYWKHILWWAHIIICYFILYRVLSTNEAFDKAKKDLPIEEHLIT